MKQYYSLIIGIVLMLSACETSKQSAITTPKAPTQVVEAPQTPPANDKTHTENKTDDLKTPQQNTGTRKRPYIPAESATQQKLIAVDSIP